jgi:peptidoglycan/xylan/chitin deacetylase (PgdA/CDA1 family)
MVVKIKKFCLTFDIEEFDIARGINEEEMYSVSLEGTKRILNLLREENVKATFFITAKFAAKYPQLIREISKEHETASHGYAHNQEYARLHEQAAYGLIQKSKETLERITKKEVQGFRAPRMKTVNPWILKKAGLKYDASSHPALIPGRMSDFLKPRKITTNSGITTIPTSVTPIVKIPLMWYGFRNYGLTYAKMCTRMASINNNYASIYFHSWEFSDLGKYDLPKYMKKNTGEKLERMLREYIGWCKKRYEFVTMSELIKPQQQ